MLRDLRFAERAVEAGNLNAPMAMRAKELYARFVDAGDAPRDFSGIIQMLRTGQSPPH